MSSESKQCTNYYNYVALSSCQCFYALMSMFYPEWRMIKLSASYYNYLQHYLLRNIINNGTLMAPHSFFSSLHHYSSLLSPIRSQTMATPHLLPNASNQLRPIYSKFFTSLLASRKNHSWANRISIGLLQY